MAQCLAAKRGNVTVPFSASPSHFIDLQLYRLVFWLIGTLPLAAALLMLTVPIRKLQHPGGNVSGEKAAG